MINSQNCKLLYEKATLKYNVLPKKASGFSLSLEIVKNYSSTVFDLTVTLKYTGICNKSSMVVIDVKMLSGFTPTMSSIEELENKGQVMKTEVKNDHVLFYLENVFGRADSFPFSVEQSNLVFNIQPAPVMVYDYYEKEEYALAFYNIDNSSVSERDKAITGRGGKAFLVTNRFFCIKPGKKS
ncbi:ovostatin homolog 2-like isoform X3 [Gorilla gorilla gorilla]|uniref:ovostatin homolog 2-like isoform X3 n=1 Tax=Gorilla gorilla gorilla TaxID=9595 RepID=UPI002445D20E|nr:ovostatin homolog 2-like isoform X3 [Gorilla gorilla gorilla]